MNWLELLISGAVVIVSIWVAHHYQKKARDEDREEDKKNFSVIKEKVSDVSINFRELVSYLKGMFGEKLADVNFSGEIKDPSVIVNHLATAQSKSPITLTPARQEGADRMGAKEMVKKYRKHIIVADEANNLTIQQACFDFALNGAFLQVTGQADRDIVHNEIYQSGQDIQHTLIIFGILFRDLIFEERSLPVPSGTSSQATKSP